MCDSSGPLRRLALHSPGSLFWILISPYKSRPERLRRNHQSTPGKFTPQGALYARAAITVDPTRQTVRIAHPAETTLQPTLSPCDNASALCVRAESTPSSLPPFYTLTRYDGACCGAMNLPPPDLGVTRLVRQCALAVDVSVPTHRGQHIAIVLSNYCVDYP